VNEGLRGVVADPFGSSSGRFDVSASYDVNALTFEAGYHYSTIERTYREATKGSEGGVSLAAIVHTRDWLLLRAMFDGGNRKATEYDQATIGLQAGHRLEWAGGTVTPYLGVQALQLDRGGFAEQGAAGFGLSTGDSTMGATQALLGARFGRGWQVGGARVMLEGRAEWQRTLSQSGTDIDARFTALDVWSPILGPALDRDVGVFGVGISSTLPRWGRVGLDLDARSEREQTYGQASLRWSLPF
jgi:uncharacterized protein with beta-barrel porin domain